MLGKKFDHKPIKKPGLLYLAGVAGSRQSFQLAIRYDRLEREGALMAAVFAAGQDDRGAGDALMMAFGIGLCESFELVDDRLHIGVFIAFGEEVRKEMRQRCGAKRRAQIFERVGPAIVDAIGRVVGDSSLGEFLVGVVTGARQHKRRRFVWAPVVHVGSEGRAD